MTGRFLASTFTAIVALTLATPALADPWDFVLTNQTGKTIKLVEVSPTGQGAWTPEVVDKDITPDTSIRNGSNQPVHFDKAGDACVFDVRLTLDDGSSMVWNKLNVCDDAFAIVGIANGAPTLKAN